MLYGQDYFYEELLGLRFKVSVFSFFQTNSYGAEVLYRTAREYIGELKKEGCVVYDLYSGTGTIAQLMAPVAEKVDVYKRQTSFSVTSVIALSGVSLAVSCFLPQPAKVKTAMARTKANARILFFINPSIGLMVYCMKKSAEGASFLAGMAVQPLFWRKAPA